MTQKTNYYLSGFVIVLFLVLGYFLAATDFKSDTLVGTPRTILIVLSFLYAAFRTFRLVKMIQKDRNDPNN